MNATQLAQAIATKHDLSAVQARSIVDSMMGSIVAAVANGGEVTLPGFGRFKSKETAARDGRNPRTGAPMKIAASKKVSFTAAKGFKDKL